MIYGIVSQPGIGSTGGPQAEAERLHFRKQNLGMFNWGDFGYRESCF